MGRTLEPAAIGALPTSAIFIHNITALNEEPRDDAVE
jgi:hypothetical protein